MTFLLWVQEQFLAGPAKRSVVNVSSKRMKEGYSISFHFNAADLLNFSLYSSRFLLEESKLEKTPDSKYVFIQGKVHKLFQKANTLQIQRPFR